MSATKSKRSHRFLFFMVVTLVGCGRKQKTVRCFEDRPARVHNRMVLPTIARPVVERNTLVWAPPRAAAPLPTAHLQGYAIHTVSALGIISRQPVAEVSSATHAWNLPLDAQQGQGYVVSARFVLGDERLEGPFSAIARRTPVLGL